MSHTYGKGNSTGNNYLNKKRLEKDIPMDNRYHYSKYEKFEKYGNYGRCNMNYTHSKPFQGNNYNNTNSRYCSNNGNDQKTFRINEYSKKIGPKRDCKKLCQKYSYQNINEGIRNLSYCDLPSTLTLSVKYKQEGDSLKSISSSTAGDSNSYLTDSNNGLNIKNINKLRPNISPFGRDKINYYDFPPKLKYKEKKISVYKEESKKWRKVDDEDDEEDIPIFKFPQLPEKLINYEPFNRNSIELEENPLENFEIFPNYLYELNIHYFSKKQNSTHITELKNKNNIGNILSLKSCYLLAKIPNWRLVTIFVPASLLTTETFKNIKPLEEESEDDDRTEEFVPLKIENKNEEEQKKNEKLIKSHLIYSEKFEEIVKKSLEQLENKKKQVKKDIFNKKYIMAQYHYDIIKLKNKIKQNIYKINYLNIKQENSSSVIEEKMISFGSFRGSFCI